MKKKGKKAPLPADYNAGTPADEKTLEEMIKERDPWLEKKENIDNLLVTLLDVAGYLHQHNRTGRSLIPANIAISESTGTVRVKGIDNHQRVSARTAAGETESESRDGDRKRDREEEFRSIGLILERLRTEVPSFPKRRYRKFERLCFKPGIYEGELYTILLPKRINLEWLLWLLVAAAVTGGVIWITTHKDTLFGDGDSRGETEEVKKDTLRDDNAAVIDSMNILKADSTTTQQTDEPFGTQDEAHRQLDQKFQAAPEKPTEQHEVENVIQNCYANLAPILAAADYLADDPQPEDEETIILYMDLIEQYLVEDKERAIANVARLRPALSEDQVIKLIESSDPYKKFTVQSDNALHFLRKSLPDDRF